ncbi:unnamed protein product [Caenorhabditis brenneri]
MANISKMSFPLFRLPILAIFEVFSSMNPFEIINLSMSSLRCKRTVKLFFRPGCEFELHFHITTSTAISIEGTHSMWEYEFTSEKEENDVIKYDADREILMKYSTNILESFINLFKYIDDLMNFKNLAFIHFDMTHFPGPNDLIIQEIKIFKRPMKWLEFYSKEDVGKEVIDMLNHVEGVKNLKLSAPFHKDFELICPPSLSYLYISDSKWINLKKLLEFNSSVVQIRDFELTDMEICTFFQSWMSSESHLNLEKFVLDRVKRETFEHVSQNLPHEEFDANAVRKFTAHHA